MQYLPKDVYAGYVALVSKIESGDNPTAKNPRSTASGRFQFIKSTWEGLGFDWQLRFDDRTQYLAFDKLTAQNAAILETAGCAINYATLYGAHFLGAQGLLKIMRAPTGARIETVTTPEQRKSNPTILKGTVLDFCNWLEKKTGHSVYKRYTGTGGNWVSGSGAVVPPVEKTDKQSTDLGKLLAGITAVGLVGVFAAGKFFGLF